MFGNTKENTLSSITSTILITKPKRLLQDKRVMGRERKETTAVDSIFIGGKHSLPKI